MARTPRTVLRALAAATATALLLSGCLPFLPRPAPEVEPGDVLEIRRGVWSIAGEYGESVDVITEDAYTTRFTVPSGEVVHDVTVPLDPEHRSPIEAALEDYLAWEATLDEDERPFCTDTPAYEIRVTGSIEHSSSMIGCARDTPLSALVGTVGDARQDLVGELADPLDRWRIEVREDQAAAPEAYTTALDEDHSGIALGGPEGSSPLDWSDSARVLSAINDVLTEADTTCSGPIGEIELVQDEAGFSRTVPICPGGSSGELVVTLREA